MNTQLFTQGLKIAGKMTGKTAKIGTYQMGSAWTKRELKKTTNEFLNEFQGGEPNRLSQQELKTQTRKLEKEELKAQTTKTKSINVELTKSNMKEKLNKGLRMGGQILKAGTLGTIDTHFTQESKNHSNDFIRQTKEATEYTTNQVRLRMLRDDD